MKPLVKCLKNHTWFFLLMAIMFLPLTAQSQVVCSPGSVPDPNNPDTICVLDAVAHPKFVNICPNPLDPSFIWQPTTPGGSHYEIGAYQFQQSLGLVNPATGAPLTTTVWGYGSATQAPTYPGRTFLIDKGSAASKPITVKWYNSLVDGAGNPLPHLLPVDSTLDWADPFNGPPNRVPGPYLGPVPLCMHLHGGHTESDSDGMPDAWFTPGYAQTGRLFNLTYLYPMDQEAATIWYHDHALGITRLNVYAGLAGFFLIRDKNESCLNLPKFPYEIPLVIQDRMFTPDGQLYYPTQPSVFNGAPSVQPEMFGDFILVNGKAWPVIDVQPRQYRLHLLNGSDSRFYNMVFFNKAANTFGPAFYQIGTDGGLLYAPVKIAGPKRLLMGPGERMDVLVDFSAFAGQTLTIINDAPGPYPDGDQVNPETTGQIMAFRVAAGTGTPGKVPIRLRPTPVALNPNPCPPNAPCNPPADRRLILGEGTNGYGRLEPLLGTVADGMLQYRSPITEKPTLNSTEVWEIYNTTPDAHPIHLHLVQFVVLNRQHFTAAQAENGALSDITFDGPLTAPQPNERGWKDTVVMLPGTVTRIAAKFDLAGEYVWHCHILSHEDHEMMRPYCVNDPATNNCNCAGPAGCP